MLRLNIELPDIREQVEIIPSIGKFISRVPKERVTELVKKARKLAAEHSAPGCSSDAFYGIAEALKIKGRREVYMATLGLPGGCGEVTRGTCGAIIGVSCAIALSFGITEKINDEIRKDVENMVPFYRKRMAKYRYLMFNKINDVIDKVKDKYGGAACADIQFERHGQTFDLRDPRIREKWHADIQQCREIESDITGWATEVLLISTSWDERLREWSSPRTEIERGDQFIREEAGFKLLPRWTGKWNRRP